MTVQPIINPPVPVGAEPDLWTALGVRDVYKIIGTISVAGRDLLRCPVVTVVAEQRCDGSIGVIDIDVDARASLNAIQARELAGLLSQGADLADQWTGAATGPTPSELLATASSALRAAHTVLRTLPGNADSYVQAALDSISDAAEVLR